ncbi:hypothetical protein FAF44_49730 [Nonomuraea sp. MG754425]|uniref:hypothetical protein n=1 Tax=Nonomuraea sp. MG754425 TaxID=2570319 RepID=UPI001F2159D1|nr:hypothetical protein [Nonomuraea sp. MG754425]MCF6476370.1 hypothetical protein [Nonomuraea sp. MG754425]
MAVEYVLVEPLHVGVRPDTELRRANEILKAASGFVPGEAVLLSFPPARVSSTQAEPLDEASIAVDVGSA